MPTRSAGLKVKSFGENVARAKYCTWWRGHKRWWKRQSAKKVRRIGKADPEFAPTKLRYAGWMD